jgi:hypothetical protein
MPTQSWRKRAFSSFPSDQLSPAPSNSNIILPSGRPLLVQRESSVYFEGTVIIMMTRITIDYSTFELQLELINLFAWGEYSCPVLGVGKALDV